MGGLIVVIELCRVSSKLLVSIDGQDKAWGGQCVMHTIAGRAFRLWRPLAAPSLVWIAIGVRRMCIAV